MKYFFPLLMGLVILVGVVVTLTPYVAGFWFPANPRGYQQADDNAAAEALAVWFATQPSAFDRAHAIRWQANGEKIRWYRFHVQRSPVERFIRQHRLQQLPLNAPVLAERFMMIVPPVDWWQPAALARTSYFQGHSGGSELRLIYNAELSTGYLLVVDG